MRVMFILKECIIKHIALTGSSNEKLLFTDKFNFLQKKLFGLRVKFHFTLVLSKVFDYNFIQIYIIEKSVKVSLVLGDLFLYF
jgi:hypothetical protein